MPNIVLCPASLKICWPDEAFPVKPGSRRRLKSPDLKSGVASVVLSPEMLKLDRVVRSKFVKKNDRFLPL